MTTPTLHCYTRVSTRIQETDGTSLENQKELGIKRAGELGFTHKIWNEGAKSSHHEDIGARPVLSSLLTDIRDGKVKHLWVLEQSRLSRNDMVASTIRYECNKAGVILYTKDGQYDLNNPSDTFTRQILDATSQLENALRTERSRMGKLQRARQGNWHGGAPPYGYSIDKKKLAINPDEARWVKRVFSEYLNGTPVIQIKTILDTNGISPRRGGAYWSLGTLQLMLRSTVYIGRYIYRDKKSEESVEVSAPKIIDDTVWYECQRKREGSLKRKGQVNRTKRFYLLRDIMSCGHCGTPIGAKTGDGVKQRHNYYYCPAKERKWKTSVNGSAAEIDLTNKTKWVRGKHCEMVRSLNIDETDKSVWEAVKDTVTKSHILKERMKQEMLADKDKDDVEYKNDLNNYKKRERTATKALQRVEETIGKVETDRLLEKMDKSLYQQVRKNLDEERTHATNELEQIRLLVKETANKKKWIDWVGKFKDTYENVDGLNPQERKEYLGGLLDRIEVFLDTDTLEHQLDIFFQLPIVGDRYENEAKGRAAEVIDGGNSHRIHGNYNAKVGRKQSKKKQTI